MSLTICGEQTNAELFKISHVRTIKQLTLPTQSINRNIISTNPHLSSVPFCYYENAQPKILLGLDNHHLGVPHQVHTNTQSDSIVAMDTKLGWVLYGSDGNTSLPSAVVMHINKDNNLNEYELLHDLVRRHFTTEDFGAKIPSAKAESDEIMRAREILRTTTKRIGNRFETGLLWKSDDVVLPDSYDMALKRLTSVEAKMRRDPNYASCYKAQIQSYVEKGYARKLNNKEAASLTSRT